MKKIILGFLSLVCVAGIAPAAHALVDNTSCTVSSHLDDASLGTLRRHLNNYNKTSNRSCTEFITFGAGTFTITPGSTLIVGAVDANGNALNTDVEYTDATHPSDGANLTITKGSASSVTIDASGSAFNEDDCVLAIKNPNVKIQNITVKAKQRDKAICGNLNPNSVVSVCVGNDCRPLGTECSPNSTCCDANGSFATAGTSCNNNSGTCGGDNATCTPNPVQECTPNSTCCDASGTHVAVGTSCDDGSASTTNDQCNDSHQCVGTTSPTAVCGNGTVESGEICDGGACCESDCSDFKSLGATCDDGNASTTGDQCNSSHVCAGTTTPAAVCGNGTVETGEVCDGGACCETNCSAYKAEGATCDDGVASTATSQCNAAHTCVGVSSPGGGGGVVTPPGTDPGTTPPPGDTDPDGGETPPVNLGGGDNGGGCVLANSAVNWAPFWMMILGMVPMMIRRKK